MDKTNQEPAMKYFLSKKVLFTIVAVAMSAIVQYGCMYLQPLSFVYRQEKGKKITIRTDAFSAKLEGYYHPTVEKGIMEVRLYFDDLETQRNAIVLDKSNIKIECGSSFQWYWIGLDADTSFENDSIILKNRQTEYFTLKFAMKCDTLQFQRAKNDSVTCFVTLPTTPDPIRVVFTETDFLRHVTGRAH